MKTFFMIIAASLISCLPAAAASFDCKKARTAIERQVCSNDELSELDSQLDAAFQSAKEKLNAAKAKQLVISQTKWLKDIRNQCNDTDCLSDAYKSRLEEIDPFADKMLTCEEMKAYPELIFTDSIDLGSGFGSPLDVDYACSESLSELAFLQKIMMLAEIIRGDEGPQPCSGSIVYALNRYYQFRLAKAGFYPVSLLQVTTSLTGSNWDDLVRSNGDDEDSQVVRYFRQWSETNVNNFQLYSAFILEFDKAFPALAKHCNQNLGLSETEAVTASRNALMIILTRAAGSFPKTVLEPESDLVRLARDGKNTVADYQKRFDIDRTSKNAPSQNEIDKALRVALVHNRPQSIIISLLEKLRSELLLQTDIGREPLLSFAINSEENLRYLLGKNVEVDGENEFGKTTLFYAIERNNHKTVDLLLQHGADVNHAYKSGEALRPENDECVHYALKHTKRTPLMHAAQHADVDMLKKLIKAGAQVEATDDLGFTALDFAVMGTKKANEEYLKALGLQYGTKK